MVYSEVCLLYKTFGQEDLDFTEFLHIGFKHQKRADFTLSPLTPQCGVTFLSSSTFKNSFQSAMVFLPLLTMKYD